MKHTQPKQSHSHLDSAVGGLTDLLISFLGIEVLLLILLGVEN